MNVNSPARPGRPHRPHRGHRWVMIACCIPMIVIFVALWATGAVSAGFLLVAAACVGLMTLMMAGMGHGESADRHQAEKEMHR